MHSSPGGLAHRGSMTPTALAKPPDAIASPMQSTTPPPPTSPFLPMELIVQRLSNLESLYASLSGDSSHSGCAPLSAMLSHGDQINKLVAGLDFLEEHLMRSDNVVEVLQEQINAVAKGDKHASSGSAKALASKVQTLGELLERLRGHMVTLDKRATGAMMGLQALQGRVGDVEAGLQEVQEKQGGSEAALQGLRGKVKGADTKLQALSGKLGSAEAGIQSLQGRLNGTELGLELLQGRLGGTESSLAQLQGSVKSGDSLLQALSGRVSGSEGGLLQLQGSVRSWETGLQQVMGRLGGAEGRVGELQGGLVEVNERLGDLALYVDGLAVKLLEQDPDADSSGNDNSSQEPKDKQEGMQAEAARLEPVLEAIAQLRREFDAQAHQQQEEQQQLWVQQQQCIQQSSASKAHEAADAASHSCITSTEAEDLRAQITHLASQLLPLKADAAESREKVEVAELRAAAAEAAARQAAELMREGGAADERAAAEAAASQAAVSMRKAEAAEERAAAAAEAAARQAAKSMRKAEAAEERAAAAAEAAREAAGVAAAAGERSGLSQIEAGTAPAAPPEMTSQLAAQEAQTEHTTNQLAALEAQTRSTAQEALTAAQRAEVAAAAAAEARTHAEAPAARMELRLHTEATAARKGGGGAGAAGVAEADSPHVQRNAAGAFQKEGRESVEAAAEGMAAQIAALTRELEELGKRLAFAECRIGSTETAMSAERGPPKVPLAQSGGTTAAVGGAPPQFPAADAGCGDGILELHGGLGQEHAQGADPAGNIGAQCAVRECTEHGTVEGARGADRASATAEEGLAGMRAIRGMIEDLQAGQAQLARDVEAATADTEECSARVSRLSRDVVEATAESGQCRVRLARVAADVEGCMQGNADVGVRVSELDGANQTLRSHHEAYIAQVQLQLDDVASAQESLTAQLRAQEAHAAQLWSQLRAHVHAHQQQVQQQVQEVMDAQHRMQQEQQEQQQLLQQQLLKRDEQQKQGKRQQGQERDELQQHHHHNHHQHQGGQQDQSPQEDAQQPVPSCNGSSVCASREGGSQPTLKQQVEGLAQRLSRQEAQLPELLVSTLPELLASELPEVLASMLPAMIATQLPEVVACELPELLASKLPELVAAQIPTVLAAQLPALSEAHAAAQLPDLVAAHLPSLVAAQMPALSEAHMATQLPDMVASQVPPLIEAQAPALVAACVTAQLPELVMVQTTALVAAQAPALVASHTAGQLPDLVATQLPSLLEAHAAHHLPDLVALRVPPLVEARLPSLLEAHAARQLPDLVALRVPCLVEAQLPSLLEAHAAQRLPDLVGAQVPALVVAHVGPVASKLNSAAQRTLDEVRKGASCANEQVRCFEARLAGLEACVSLVQANTSSSQESPEGKASRSQSCSKDLEQDTSRGAGSSTKQQELLLNEEEQSGGGEGSVDGLEERVEAMEQHVGQLSEQLQSQVQLLSVCMEGVASLDDMHHHQASLEDMRAKVQQLSEGSAKREELAALRQALVTFEMASRLQAQQRAPGTPPRIPRSCASSEAGDESGALLLTPVSTTTSKQQQQQQAQDQVQQQQQQQQHQDQHNRCNHCHKGVPHGECGTEAAVWVLERQVDALEQQLQALHAQVRAQGAKHDARSDLSSSSTTATDTNSTSSHGTSVQGPGTPPFHSGHSGGSSEAPVKGRSAGDGGKGKEYSVHGVSTNEADEGGRGSDSCQGGPWSSSSSAKGVPGGINLADMAARQAAMEQKVESYGKVLQAMRNRIVAMQEYVDSSQGSVKTLHEVHASVMLRLCALENGGSATPGTASRSRGTPSSSSKGS